MRFTHVPSLTLVCLSMFGLSKSALADQFVEWSLPTAGSAGNLDVINNLNINSGDVTVITDFTATDPTFISQFGTLIPSLHFAAPPAGADIASGFTFSAAMPTGSRLLIFDVDFFDERLTLLSQGSPLQLLDQLEIELGATSVFPGYDPLTGLLSNNAQTQANEWEASVFDISGLTSVDVEFLRSPIANANTSGIRLAIYTHTVPEPSSAILAGLFMTAGLLSRRK